MRDPGEYHNVFKRESNDMSMWIVYIYMWFVYIHTLYLYILTHIHIHKEIHIYVYMCTYTHVSTHIKSIGIWVSAYPIQICYY